MKIISFRNDPIYDVSTETILFSAVIAGELIPCAITSQALQDCFESKSRMAIDIFRKHRSAIEEVAERLIASARFEDDGLVLIKKDDCNNRSE